MRSPSGTVIRNAGAGGRKICLYLENTPKKHFEDEISAYYQPGLSSPQLHIFHTSLAYMLWLADKKGNYPEYW